MITYLVFSELVSFVNRGLKLVSIKHVRAEVVDIGHANTQKLPQILPRECIQDMYASKGERVMSFYKRSAKAYCQVPSLSTLFEEFDTPNERKQPHHFYGENVSAGDDRDSRWQQHHYFSKSHQSLFQVVKLIADDGVLSNSENGVY